MSQPQGQTEEFMETEVQQDPARLKEMAKTNLRFGRTYFQLFESIAEIDYHFFENS